MTIKEMKSQLKTLAEKIRNNRLAFKLKHQNLSLWESKNPDWRDWRSGLYKERYTQLYAGPCHPGVRDSTDFRYLHVAYCIARGRKYEEIEPKVREENKLDMGKLQNILDEVTHEPEALCASAV